MTWPFFKAALRVLGRSLSWKTHTLLSSAEVKLHQPVCLPFLRVILLYRQNSCDLANTHTHTLYFRGGCLCVDTQFSFFQVSGWLPWRVDK